MGHLEISSLASWCLHWCGYYLSWIIVSTIFENIKFCKEFGNSSNYIKFHKKEICISFFEYIFIDFIDMQYREKKAPGYSDCSRDSYSSTFWKIDRERLQWSPFLSIYYLQLYKFYLKLSLIGWSNFFNKRLHHRCLRGKFSG